MRTERSVVAVSMTANMTARGGWKCFFTQWQQRKFPRKSVVGWFWFWHNGV